MYFLFFKLHCQSKRSAAQPQTICSEVPLFHNTKKNYETFKCDQTITIGGIVPLKNEYGVYNKGSTSKSYDKVKSYENMFFMK